MTMPAPELDLYDSEALIPTLLARAERFEREQTMNGGGGSAAGPSTAELLRAAANQIGRLESDLDGAHYDMIDHDCGCD